MIVIVFQVKMLLDELLEKLPEVFNLTELQGRAEEKTPYVLVALQECERMNNLTSEIRRSLKELDLGLKVHHTQRPMALVLVQWLLWEYVWSLLHPMYFQGKVQK